MEENKNTTILAEQQNNVLFQDACQIIEQAQESAYRQVNETLIKRNWLLGLRIQHEVLKDKRAEYGEQVVKKLAQSLVERFGKGFQVANLYHFIAFYNYHPDIFYAVSRKSVDGNIENILNSLRSKSSIRPRYSVLNNNDQLFAAKYLTYMPTQEELRREIEQQKEFFRLQHKEDE